MPPPQNREPVYLTAEQLAKRWDVTRQYIYNRRHAGNPMPEALKKGKHLLFPLDKVEAFEASERQDGRLYAAA